MMTDPISDMLTRIRNALAVNKVEVVVPYSKLKSEIARILEESGYVLGQEKKETDHSQLVIKLKYKNNRPAIQGLKRVSRPGRRVYVGKEELPVVLNNLGIAVISTPKGLMTNKQAKQNGVGGEVICEVY